ncbi:tetraspanin-2A [Homalodisca vitripennis]|nr:tetraspanin-2A [Homalodisca vitripennis]
MAASEKLEKSISTIKYFLFCLDIVTFGLGLTVLGLSVWLWVEDEFSDIIDYLNISIVYLGLYIIMLKSLLVVLVSLFACAAALLENVFFLLINSIAQLVLFVVGLLGAAVLLTFTTVGSSIQSDINNSMVNYTCSYIYRIVYCCAAHLYNRGFQYPVRHKQLHGELHLLLYLQNSIAQLVLFVVGLLGAAVLLTFTTVGSSIQSDINNSMYPVRHKQLHGELHLLLYLQNSIAQLVLFVVGLLGAAVLLTFTTVGSSIQSDINNSMVNYILWYPNSDWANGRLSEIQENVGCCGGSGPNDYVTRWKPLPTECRDSVTGNAFFYGCMDEVTWYLEGRCYWITGLTILLCFFHVLNAVCSFILLQAVRKEEEESGGRYK